eukprot:jgi/Chrzof1/15274/UNPLg00671.t1
MRQDYDIMVQTIVAKAEHVTEGDPLGIIDNACGYLKRLIDRHVDATGDKRWPNFLGSILEAFNEHQNSDMDYMTPNEVYDDMPHMLDKWRREVAYNRSYVADLPIKVGDRVRVIEGKGKLQKGLAQMSKQTYVVERVSPGGRYILRDRQGVTADRRYKANELYKVSEDAPDIEEPSTSRRAAQQEQAASRQERAMRREGLDDVDDVPHVTSSSKVMTRHMAAARKAAGSKRKKTSKPRALYNLGVDPLRDIHEFDSD